MHSRRVIGGRLDPSRRGDRRRAWVGRVDGSDRFGGTHQPPRAPTNARALDHESLYRAQERSPGKPVGEPGDYGADDMGKAGVIGEGGKSRVASRPGGLVPRSSAGTRHRRTPEPHRVRSMPTSERSAARGLGEREEPRVDQSKTAPCKAARARVKGAGSTRDPSRAG